MADKDFLDYDLLIASGMSPPVANALLTMWERTGAARDVLSNLDELGGAAAQAEWGSIEGTLSDQTDLQAALDAKADVGASGLTFLDLGSLSGSVEVDYTAADVQAITATGDFTLTVSGWPTSGTPAVLRLVLYDGNAHTLTLPAWTWMDGAEPPLSSHDRIALYSEDGGTSVYALRYFAADSGILHDNIAGEIAALTGKATPVDADVAMIEDSAAANAKKKLTWANVKATLKTYFDGLYAALAHTHPASDVVSGTFADARVAESNVTQHQGAIDHDALTNFVAAEHIDWSATGAEDVHADRIGETAVTQHEAALTITESQISDLDHDDADAIHDNVAGEIAAVTEKATPVSADLILIEDSAASNAKKRAQLGNLPAGSVAWANITGQEVDAAQDLVYHGSVISGTETANLGNGLAHRIKAAGDFTLALSGWPAAGKHETAEILAVNWGAHTVTLPDALDWGTAGAPTFSTAALDRVLLSSDANGILTHARLDGQGFEAYTRLIATGAIVTGSLTRNSTATYWDSAGELQTAAIDTARTDYDPSDNSLRGLLVEEQRTNLVYNSFDFTAASWSKDKVSVTDTGVASPIDGVNWQEIEVTDDTGTNSRVDGAGSFTGGADDPLAHSWVIKPGNWDWIMIQSGGSGANLKAWLDLSTLTWGNSSGDNLTLHDPVELDSGGLLIRISFTHDNNGGTTNCALYLTDSNSSQDVAPLGSTVQVAAAQLENGNPPTSLIETGGTTATREDDDVTATVGGSFPDPVSYEIVATAGADQDAVLYQADDGTENNRLRIARVSGNLRVIVTDGGTEQANLDLGAITDFTEFTVRAAFAANDVAASLNGAASVTDTSATMPSGITTRRYGKDTTGEHWNGWVRDADEHLRRMPNAELEA